MIDISPDPTTLDSIQPVLSAKPEPTGGPRPGIALCLSGGGYRAMIFHLGTLLSLNELGFLKKLARVSSVSGGSITAGVLARHGRVTIRSSSAMVSARLLTRTNKGCAKAHTGASARTSPITVCRTR